MERVRQSLRIVKKSLADIKIMLKELSSIFIGGGQLDVLTYSKLWTTDDAHHTK